MMHHIPASPPFSTRVSPELSQLALCDALAEAMQATGLLEVPAPAAALRWIETFARAFRDRLQTVGDAVPIVADLRAEAVMIPALQLEKLRNRQVLFYLDTIGQYVDDQPELRDIPVENDLLEIAKEFGIAPGDALWAARMALTAQHDGPPLALLFPLLGHDRIMIRLGALSSHLLHGRGLKTIKYGPDGKPFETIGAAKPGTAR